MLLSDYLHHGSLHHDAHPGSLGRAANWPARRRHVLVEEVLLGDLGELFHLVTKLPALHAESNLAQ